MSSIAFARFGLLVREFGAHLEEPTAAKIPDPLFPRVIRSIHAFASRSRAAQLRGGDTGGTIRTNRAGFGNSTPPKTAWLTHAPGTIRTCDLCLRRAALYPLSYGRSSQARIPVPESGQSTGVEAIPGPVG